MTQARNQTNAYAGYELDARSGAFVNDTLPGTDGSVLGANTVPETSDKASGRSYALTTHLPKPRLWQAAIGGGLLMLGMAYVGARMWTRPSRSFMSSFMRRRPRRWSFAR